MKLRPLLVATVRVLIILGVFGYLSGAETLAKELHAVGRTGLFVAPTAQQAAQLEALFVALLTDPSAPANWEAAGWQLQKSAAGVVTVSEIEDRGGGYYQLRPGSGKEVFIQAPHRFFDRMTKQIALRLFQQGPFRGVAWNSKHRYHPAVAKGTSSDLAHMENSPFTAQGRAIAKLYPEAVLVQLHGFDKAGKQRKRSAVSADLIVSSGSRRPSLRATRLAECLANGSFGVVRLYPRDVQVLGGTSNVTGTALAAMGFGGFIHIEMAIEIRQRLLENAALLGQMVTCLASL